MVYAPRSSTIKKKGEENDSHFKTMELLLTYIDSHKLHDMIDGRDDDGRTALMYAVMQGHTEVIEPLLHHGANLSILDNDGWNVICFFVWPAQIAEYIFIGQQI